MQSIQNVLRFEGFTLDPARGTLSGVAGEIKLRPKSFDVLCYLAGKADQLVAKDELVEAVWGKAVVSDESVARCISDIRAALADREGRMIKTLPRRGYRFSAELEVASTPNKLSVVPSAGRVHKLGVCVALLPFTSLNSEPVQKSFGDGIAEEILRAMGHFRPTELRVIYSGTAYKTFGLNVKQVGRDLGAQYLIRGNVQTAGGRVRIGCQLLDAATGRQLWNEKFEIGTEVGFDFQDQVAAKVALAIYPIIVTSELENAQRKHRDNWTAFDHYAKAAALILQVSRERHSEILEELRQSITIEPNFAGSRAVLAALVFRMIAFGQFVPRELLDEALSSTERALILNSSNSGLLATCAFGLLALNGELERALILTERAVALNTDDNLAWIALGYAKACFGEIDAAKMIFEKSLKMDGLTRSFVHAAYFGYLLVATIAEAEFDRLQWAHRILAHFPEDIFALETAWDINFIRGRNFEAEKFAGRLKSVLSDCRNLRQMRNSFAFRHATHAAAFSAVFERVESFFFQDPNPRGVCD